MPQIGQNILLQTQELGPVLFWSFLLIVLILLMFVAIIYLKRWLAEDAPVTGGFTLGDLRQMRASGQMSEEEYERAKIQMVGAVQRAAEKMGAQKASSAGPGRAIRPPPAAGGTNAAGPFDPGGTNSAPPPSNNSNDA